MKNFIIYALVFLILLNFAVAQVLTSTIKIIGVDKEGRGIEGNLTVEIQPGKGRILIDTYPMQGFYTQDSERKAVKVAADITKFNFSTYDVIFSINTPNVISVDGPSAGAAMTIATIAAIQNKTISPRFSITGTIEEDHSIGKVGMVFAKAKAAADSNIAVFLIPKGQAQQIEYVRKVRTPAPGWRIETIEPIKINLIEYAKENWEISIYEVATIDEALKYAFEEISENNNKTKIESLKIELSFKSPLKSYEEFEYFAKSALTRAETNYNRAKTKLSSSTLPDDVESELTYLLKTSKELLEEGKDLLKKGYKYSAGNNAFKSSIYSQTIIDLVNYYQSSPANRELFIENKIREIELEMENAEAYVEGKALHGICSEKDFEWSLLALQRINYAKNRLNKISIEDEESVFFDINVAKEWVIIAKELANKIESRVYKDCSSQFEKEARKAIDEAENKINKLKVLRKDVSSSEPYLEAAKLEYESNQYIVAFFDASIAKARAEAVEKFEGKDIDEIYKEINTTNYVPNNLVSAIFFEHATYMFHKAIEKGSHQEAYDAIQIYYSSFASNEAYNKILENMDDKKINTNQLIIVILVFCLVMAIVYIGFLTSKMKNLRRIKKVKKIKR